MYISTESGKYGQPLSYYENSNKRLTRNHLNCCNEPWPDTVVELMVSSICIYEIISYFLIYKFRDWVRNEAKEVLFDISKHYHFQW